MRNYLISLVFLILFSPQLTAQQATIEQCQRYKDQAENYQQRRRKGGSGPQMDQWKNKMRAYKKQYNDGNCQKFRHKLKR